MALRVNSPTVHDDGDYRFEVAFSIAGEDKRDTVRKVASIVQKQVGNDKVFFDECLSPNWPDQTPNQCFKSYTCTRRQTYGRNARFSKSSV